MEVIISIVGSLAAKAAEYTVDPTIRQLSYLFKPKTKFLNLRSKVQELKDARERLQQSVDSATRKGEVIFDDVQRWLTVANEKISEEDEEKAMKRCFAGFCPDFKSSYQLSKKADREANAIAQLLTKKDAFNAVGYLPAVEVMDIIRPVKEYEAFASRNGAFDRVMAALEDDAVSIIGVYGMGGVGKTTLVKEAAKQAKEKQLFTEVVLVSINQKPSMVNIQKEIAEKLGMTLSEDNIDVRAARLCERLKAKRILVVLDDIWESLELEALGISSGDEHKMLMTSRRLDVLESLNSQPNISIETLKQDEAWTLFKKMAGLVEGSDFQSTAVEVAKRCAGLPIAIATIAKALKPKKNLFEWKDALQQLSQPSERNFKGTPKDAYLAIELSYTFLDAEELGPIFLLCSIMGHDADPEDLLRYAIGLGFIHGLNDMEARRNRILTSVNNLKASCLLLEGSRPNRFDMHDVVRDVAQSIASRDLHWLALTKEWPYEEKMKESQLISLQNVEDSELLNHELECPNLDYFSVGLESFSPLKISENFFKGTQRLKVLEFGETNFRALPSSIGCLKTLCTLRLRGCDFEDIGILGELGNLEILDLSRSTMKMLPKEIGQLTRLKLLDLSVCDDLEVISPNVLSKLSRLEELYLYGSFDRWEVEGIENPRRNSSLVELQHLPLTTLEVYIPDVEVIPKDNLFLGKMERFKISIGDEKWDSYGDRGIETSRMLKLKMNKSIHLVDGIKLLLGKTQSLYLDGLEDVGEMQMLCHPNVESFGQLKFMKVRNCNMLKNLFSFSIAKTLCQLEELEVSDCENIIELIAENEEMDENDILEFNKLRILRLENLQSFNGLLYSENTHQSSPWLFDKKVILPELEELKIWSIGNLERLWPDLLVEHSFFKLTSIELRSCDKLLNVFPLGMLKRLQRLHTLLIENCESVEEIISGGSIGAMDVITFEFPALTYLGLSNLPNLKRIHHNKMHTINWPSLKQMKVRRCRAVEILFASGETSNEQSLFWVNEVSYPVLEKLEVKECRKLKYVFTLSSVKSFVQLKTLKVSECDEMEGVIEGTLAATEDERNSGIIRVFPKLDSLQLERLPELRRFCCGINPIEFLSLKRLIIQYCRDLNTFVFDDGKSKVTPPRYFFNEKVILPELEELEIMGMDNSERLWPDLLVEHSFSRLTFIKLRSCDKLLNVFPLSMLTRLQRLDSLIIWDCESVEEIISGGSSSAMPSLSPQFIQSDVITFEFPALTSLELSGLRNLKSVHHNKIHTINWPSLQEMEVKECDRVEILFASGETSSEQPLFWVNESTFPNLNKLTLESNAGIKEIIFQSEEGGEEKPASLLLSQITELSLLYLPEMMHLVPSWVSFLNLETLKVMKCHGIIKLFTHSTAKSLVQLREMYIKNCENIEEIMQGGDDDDDEISFAQLNQLELGHLTYKSS